MELSKLKAGNELQERIVSLQSHITDIGHYLDGIELNKKNGNNDVPMLELSWDGCEPDGDFLRTDYFDTEALLRGYVGTCVIRLSELQTQFDQL